MGKASFGDKVIGKAQKVDRILIVRTLVRLLMHLLGHRKIDPQH